MWVNQSKPLQLYAHTIKVWLLSKLFITLLQSVVNISCRGCWTGFMACTLSVVLAEDVLPERKPLSEQIDLIGCSRLQTQPKSIYAVELKLYGTDCVVPVSVVPGQRDD